MASWFLLANLLLGLKAVNPIGDPETTKLEGVANFELTGEDVFFEIVDPEDLSYTYRTRPARDFGSNFRSNLFRKSVRLVPVIPKNGCATNLRNANLIHGNVAFVERGECSFVSKAVSAEMAGAKAVIIYDNVETDDFFTEMIDDQSGQDVSIPATFLFGKNGRMISTTLDSLSMDYALINIPVNVSYVPLNEWKQPPWTQW